MFQLLLMVGKLEWLFGDVHDCFYFIERGERSEYLDRGWLGWVRVKPSPAVKVGFGQGPRAASWSKSRAGSHVRRDGAESEGRFGQHPERTVIFGGTSKIRRENLENWTETSARYPEPIGGVSLAFWLVW